MNRSESDKGQCTAIIVVGMLKRSHLNAVLILVGDSVRFLGQRNDIPDILAATDIFLIPSGHPEAFAYSALEAMCAGCPVVASRIGGLPEMLAAGQEFALTLTVDKHVQQVSDVYEEIVAGW